MTLKEVYLGDGVYASFDGFQICLRTPREGAWEMIYLEPKVYRNLMGYAETVWPHEGVTPEG